MRAIDHAGGVVVPALRYVATGREDDDAAAGKKIVYLLNR
jgi:hypothetical protein